MSKANKLEEIDWNFKNADTSFLTHSLHPYTAKFIPQIPGTIIEVLSEEDDLIYDPFVGSGTTLVEAIRRRRDAIGSDINPLSVLIAQTKSTPIPEKELNKIDPLLDRAAKEINAVNNQQTLADLDNNRDPDFEEFMPNYDKLGFWFKDFIIKELAILKKNIEQVEDEKLRNFLKTAMSSIIIKVSNQDSETRYTRREKNLEMGDVYKNFEQKINKMKKKIKKLNSEVSQEIESSVRVADARKLKFLNTLEDKIDLVVTSPPYPNAFSYHLYHRNRLVWLDFDYKELKKDEIGSHRKYSKKNGADRSTFLNEMKECLENIYPAMSDKGYAVFVIGDSIVDGDIIKNDEIIRKAGEDVGFKTETVINRDIDKISKSVNPKIGSIKEENLVVLKK